MVKLILEESKLTTASIDWISNNSGYLKQLMKIVGYNPKL